jgi:hypothetical protein
MPITQLGDGYCLPIAEFLFFLISFLKVMMYLLKQVYL